MAKIKIGELFNLEKGSLQSSKCTPGQYNFITAAEKWKTHNMYTHDIEALVFAAMASGSLGRTHYVNGKFIASDLCYIMTPKDSKKFPINIPFYYFVFNSLRDDIVKNTKSGTSKEAINQTNLKNYEIPYFDIEQQNLWIEKLKKTRQIKEELIKEIKNQQTLLKKLRQSILQEAIEGKLTKTWRESHPNIEPASVLLEKIKAEKEQMLKEKKIRKQKPLPPISEEEKPFEIPDGWEWSRLGDILDQLLGGYAYKSPLFKKDGHNQVLRLGNIRPYQIRFNEKPVYISDELANETINWELKTGDILITMTGTRGKKDYCYTVMLKEQDFKNKRIFLNQRLGCFRFNSNINTSFYDFVLKTDILLDNIYMTATGSANQANIGSTALNNWIVPLPSFEEQKEIVKKIEALFKICDTLEEQIDRAKVDSEMLMQAVLREAFEG